MVSVPVPMAFDDVNVSKLRNATDALRFSMLNGAVVVTKLFVCVTRHVTIVINILIRQDGEKEEAEENKTINVYEQVFANESPYESMYRRKKRHFRSTWDRAIVTTS